MCYPVLKFSIMNLPNDFVEKMNTLLQDEATAFWDSFSEKEQKAIWLNSSVISKECFEANANDYFSPIPHMEGGYYFEGEKIGADIFHQAGAVYSQDPAAMLPALSVAVEENWRVLDLCAAPGGKSTQLATMLSKVNGTLVSNEIHPGRNKILVENLQRMGFRNCIVTKLSPEEIALAYPAYFDLVVVDAPCSGEGMFRKYPESIGEWSAEQVKVCSDRQKEILSEALSCVKPGGYLIYSTCTYSQEENEEMVDWMMKNYPFRLHSLPKTLTEVTDFHPSFLAFKESARRCYPHKYRGEGQFMACLQKEGELVSSSAFYVLPKDIRPLSKSELKLMEETLKSSLAFNELNLYHYKDKILILPQNPVSLPPHGIVQCGVLAGAIEKKRFVPNHHLFRAYGQLFQNKYEIGSKPDALQSYLSGNELFCEEIPNGFGVVTYHGVPLGGFKASGGRLKNHYPKYLRNYL